MCGRGWELTGRYSRKRNSGYDEEELLCLVNLAINFVGEYGFELNGAFKFNTKNWSFNLYGQADLVILKI